MASLRLTFPEKDQPTVIALTGARLTIGRLPFNTIQIIDRTVSGFHAELISEHGHYRLHDRGSSNGTFVNGQKVADYHLNEACTIAFGTVEAEFNPEVVPAGEEAETFPTRNEINGVRQENVELRATVAALREEAAALQLAKPVENAEVALHVPKEEFDKVVIEREALKEARLKQDEELNRVKADLAVLKRDRVNLQLAYDSVQRELADLRAKGGVEAAGVAPRAAAAVLSAQAGEVRVAVPRAKEPIVESKPAVEEVAAEKTVVPVIAEDAKKVQEAPVVEKAPVAVSPVPAAPAPAVTAMPKPSGLPAPRVLPKAPGAPLAPAAPSSPMKPFAPLPKAPVPGASAAPKPPVAPVPVAVPANGAPAKAPIGLGSGIRPLARPATAPGDGPIDGKTLPLASVPTARPGIRPLPGVKPLGQPTVKAAPVPQPGAGPKGTQKL